MIIDCHGHYTTEPTAQIDWRRAQLKLVEAGDFKPTRALLDISDDAIREGINDNQLKPVSYTHLTLPTILRV